MVVISKFLYCNIRNNGNHFDTMQECGPQGGTSGLLVGMHPSQQLILSS
jgi:hypothetical protein